MKTLTTPLLPLLFLLSAYFFTLVISQKDCVSNKRLSTSKLICYYSNIDEIDGCYCTHVILPSNADVKSIARVRGIAKGVKVYVSVNEFNQGLISILKSSKVDGLEINLNKLDSKNDISDFISTVKSKLGSNLDIVISVPSKSDLVAKYFDFKALNKYTDLFILQTAFLGASKNVTFHPSRLSGMWDMQNTDSVVDLIGGLGAPLSKLVIAAPVQAFQFTLQNEEYTAPGSPALEIQSITRDELCKVMNGGQNWTLERDEDQAGPYIFRQNQWIAFEDLKSIDIKAKYARVRGLAGIALKDLTQDGGADCGSTILEATYNGLSRQARAPRGAVLHSLEREILESPTKPFDSVQLSPFRISRIIDTEGKIHITRQDSRTEFKCSRQGYFVHPRSCNRFYRCVKFDQRSDDFNVFEFDCPAGLAFDERVEVCVWPGSLPHGTPCSGSSEIAPVPRKRFECPSEPGYYADPENCRWFFACLDHGKSPLEAYEFRCPFGLGFDGERLVCEWPWLVPKCANGFGLDSEYYYGGASSRNEYSGKGTLSSGLVLQNYDGLGALGTIRLGGISGTIEKPIATVYSNVDSGAVGLGYQNNGGYIVGGGLGYKAAQSLANAGLLKVNNGAGYQAVVPQNQLGAIYTTSDLNSGNANIQYSSRNYDAYGQKLNSEYATGLGYSGAEGAAVSTQSFTQHTDSNRAQGATFLINANGDYNSGSNAYIAGQTLVNLQHQGAAGQYQDTSLHLVQGNLEGTAYEGTGYQDTYNQVAVEGQQSGNYPYQHKIIGVHSGGENSGYEALNGYTGAAVANLGNDNSGYTAINNQNNNVYSNSGSYVSGKTDFSQFTNVNGPSQYNSLGTAGAAVSAQSFTQYHGQQESKSSANYDSGLTGNINIVGGGYSAVGTLAGVQVSNNGDNDDVKTVSFSSTPSPISVTTYAPVSTVASVPIVTAVPVPGIKTALGFDTFKGGVIANIPELQYKVKTHGDASFLANTSSSFANFVVTTPAIVTKEVQQDYAQGGGYVYERPEKSSEVGLLNVISVSTARPLVTVNTQEPKVYVASTIKSIEDQPNVAFQGGSVMYSTSKPAVSIESYQKYNTYGGYKYEKPLVAFEEKSQGAVINSYPTVSTPKPVVYVVQQPQVYVSSTPVTPIVKTSSLTSFTQGINQQDDGYYYNKPAVNFEENPTNPIVISKFSIKTPSVQQPLNTDYYYKKPIVQFEQRPIVPQQSAVINELPTVQLEQKYVVQNNGYQHPVQPAVVSQYYHQQPVIKQQIVPIYKQPELLTTYTYQPPVQKTVYKQPVSTYTYQNVAHESLGVSYTKPDITVIPKPVQTYSYQPSGGSSYQYIKFEKDLKEKPIAIETQGYLYPKPSIAFEEKPQLGVVPTFHYATSKPNIIVQETKTQKGYVYEKPAVTFQETPLTYSTPKPIIAVQPAEVNSYFNIGSSKSEDTVVEQKDVGYSYPQPIVKFEATPITYSTPKPFIAVKPVVNVQSSTPTANIQIQEPVIYSTPKSFVVQPVEQQKISYTYPQPQIKFEEKPVQPAVESNYNYVGSTTPQPNVLVGGQSISYTPKPQVIVHQPALVTSYFHQQPSQPISSKGYEYPKPAVQFIEEPEPIVNVYENQQPVQEVPFVKNTAYVTGQYQQETQENYNYQQSLQGNYKHTGKVVVENYVNPNYERVHQQQPQVVLNYIQSTPKPDLVSTIRAVITKKLQPVTPATITFYDSRYTVAPETYPSSTVVPEINIVSTTSRPISRYSFSSQDSQYQYNRNQYNQNIGSVKYIAPELISYDYISTTPKSNIVVEEQPISYTPQSKVILEQKPAVVTSYFNQQSSLVAAGKGYNYPKPAIQFVEEPQPVYTSYENKQPVQEVPLVKKTAYVTGGYHQNVQDNYQQNYQETYQPTGKVVVENYVHPNYEKVKQAVFGQKVYQQPQVVLNYISSTPKPSFASTIKAIGFKNIQPVTPATVTSYDSRYSSTPEYYVSTTVAPQINIISSTSRPISRYSFSSLDDQYQYNQYIDIVKTTPEPVKTYLPVTSRVKVTSPLPKITTTHEADAFIVPEVTTLSRDYLPIRVGVKDPAKEYLPVKVTTPSREYLPSRQRVAVTTIAPEITTLFREYLPVKSRVRVISTGAPLDELSYTSKPPAAFHVARPITVIKQNDAHPLLSAKLGAQCTCVSSTLRLRKKQKIVIVDDDDQSDDNDDGYIVDDGNQGNIVQNYNYESQKIVDITPTPQVYVQSTSEAPQVYIKKRVKVRPVLNPTNLPVTDVSDIFYKKYSTVDDSIPSDREIAKAVRTGLKLVKQAAKEGAQEALSAQHFDRFGPGGVRSRSETLQGTIDCQRAGLFRHPTECNKFYACRWDCTKNRFTLHVFNCPVHLTFDNTLGACNWPSQGPACVENTLITSD